MFHKRCDSLHDAGWWELVDVTCDERRDVLQRAILVHVRKRHETMAMCSAITLELVCEGHRCGNASIATHALVVVAQVIGTALIQHRVHLAVCVAIWTSKAHPDAQSGR